MLVLYLIMVICQIDDHFSAGLRSGLRLRSFIQCRYCMYKVHFQELFNFQGYTLDVYHNVNPPSIGIVH